VEPPHAARLTPLGVVGEGAAVSWETRLLDLLDDLEQQAGGLALVERDAAVAELGRAEYAEVELEARLHASVGQSVRLAVQGSGIVQGRLERAGSGWCVVTDEQAARSATVVRVAALSTARGLSPRALPEAVRGPLARLGVGSVLRRIAEEAQPLVLVLVDGGTRRGSVLRVGADFVEITTADGGAEVVPFGALATVRQG
jgi:hypothetical protein